ncbi:MAG: arylesterase [Gammaproteobacteria bacterium]|nr:arylesterase [Gammaproteobacteria bacterium]
MMRSFLLILLLFWAPSVLYAEEPVILIVGDSLSAGYGMKLEQSWPRLLQRHLDDEGQKYRVMNASITGDTTQGGLNRLPGLLSRHQPRLVIIELGGNDGLRGLGLQVTRNNLTGMIEQSIQAGARVLLAGIQLPPNYGSAYTDRFRDMFRELAEKFDIMLVPFFMESVALNPDLMQGDGIHPNARAQPVLLQNVLDVLEPALFSESAP